MASGITADVGPNFEQADRDLRLFAERARRSLSDDSKRKNKAPKNWDAYAGNPWPEEARLAIEEGDQTPATSINVVLQTVEALRGDQIVNRREIQFKPSDLGKHDDVLANWMTRLVRHFFQQAAGHRAESDAILEQLVAGLGWIHAYTDDTRMPPRIGIEWVPDNEMFRDCDAHKVAGEDARYALRRTEWDLDDAKVTWPEKADLFEANAGVSEPFPVKVDDENAETSLTPGKRDKVEIWEYQFMRLEPYVAYEPEDPQTGERLPMARVPKKEFNKLFLPETLVHYRDLLTPDKPAQTATLTEFGKLLEKAGPKDAARYEETGRQESNRPERFTEYGRPVYYVSKIHRSGTGKDSWVEKPKRRPLTAFNYIPIRGYWRNRPEEGRIELFGLVETIWETQLLIAKVLTQTVQMLARAAKGGGFVNKGVLADPDNFKATQGVPGKWHLTEQAVSDGDIKPMPSPTFPHFHGELLRILRDSIATQTGITEYYSGTARQERSEVLVSNLQSRSQTTLAALTDPVEAARLVLGTVMMEIIQTSIPAATIQQILGEDADVEGVTFEYQIDPETGRPAEDPETGEPVRNEIATAAQLIKQRSVADFDVVVDTGEANTHEKGAILNVMGQVLQNAEAMPEFMRNMLYKVFLAAFPLPKGQARDMAEEFERQLKQTEDLQTIDGVAEALQGMSPEEIQQIQQLAEQLLAQLAPPPEAAPAPEAAA